MELTIPDYAILSATIACAVVGLFVGVSGALAFLSGAVAAAATAYFAWPLSTDFIGTVGLRGLAVGVLALLVFGCVRWLVKKCVHGLVAQPGDALLGSAFAALSGACIALGVAWLLELLMPENQEVSSRLLDKLFILIGR